MPPYAASESRSRPFVGVRHPRRRHVDEQFIEGRHDLHDLGQSLLQQVGDVPLVALEPNMAAYDQMAATVAELAIMRDEDGVPLLRLERQPVIRVATEASLRCVLRSMTLEDEDFSHDAGDIVVERPSHDGRDDLPTLVLGGGVVGAHDLDQVDPVRTEGQAGLAHVGLAGLELDVEAAATRCAGGMTNDGKI